MDRKRLGPDRPDTYASLGQGILPIRKEFKNMERIHEIS